jgi:hypothetical protein
MTLNDIFKSIFGTILTDIKHHNDHPCISTTSDATYCQHEKNDSFTAIPLKHHDYDNLISTAASTKPVTDQNHISISALKSNSHVKQTYTTTQMKSNNDVNPISTTTCTNSDNDVI